MSRALGHLQVTASGRCRPLPPIPDSLRIRRRLPRILAPRSVCPSDPSTRPMLPSLAPLSPLSPNVASSSFCHTVCTFSRPVPVSANPVSSCPQLFSPTCPSSPILSIPSTRTHYHNNLISSHHRDHSTIPLRYRSHRHPGPDGARLHFPHFRRMPVSNIHISMFLGQLVGFICILQCQDLPPTWADV